MDEVNESGAPTRPIPVVSQPRSRGWPRWAASLGAILVVAAGMYFLGRWTKGNAQEAAYHHQESLLKQARQSLNAQRAVFEQRQAQLAKERASLGSTQATVSQQQASLAKQQASLAQQTRSLHSALATMSHDQAVLKQEQAALATTKTQVAQQQGVIKQQGAELQHQQATMNQELGAVKATQFDNGLFEVGRDIRAGTYHTDGAQAGAQCSWSLLRSGNPSDVAGQNTSSGPQTVTVNSAFFLSHGCSTWTKVG